MSCSFWQKNPEILPLLTNSEDAALLKSCGNSIEAIASKYLKGESLESAFQAKFGFDWFG